MKVRNAVMRNRARSRAQSNWQRLGKSARSRSRAQSNWQRLGKGVRGNVSV